MLEVIQKKQFVKSLKRYKHNKPVLIELEKVLKLLINNKPIPKQYKDHALKGGFKGVRECHLQPDTLLLYFVIEDDILKLIDIGSHSNALKM